jgi:hypothetical protein
MTKSNLGYYNSGDSNSGDHNSGYFNLGNYNSGDCNSGNYNSGNYNSGDYNSGDLNSGNYNSGDYNSGDCNSGDYNSGDCNSGDSNSGDHNSGYFNTNTPKVRLFNKDSNLKFNDESLVKVRYIIREKVKTVCVWINEKDMTSEEKEKFNSYKTTGGYLKTRDYKYCWKKGWEKMTNEEKETIKLLPNFCPIIFKEITGVDVETTKKKVTFELTDEQLIKIRGILND